MICGDDMTKDEWYKWYTNENIDQMLMERHLNKKASAEVKARYET